MPGKSASSDGGSQQEVWRRRLDEAEHEYHAAIRSYAEAVDLNQGQEAVTAAERRKAAAREEYQRLLRIFSDLIVRGKAPKQ